MVIRRQVATERRLREIYASHGRGLGRKPSEILAGYGLDQEFGMALRDLDRFYSAARWVLIDYRKPSVVADAVLAKDVIAVADRMGDWRAAAELFFEAIRSAHRPLQNALERAPVMAVALGTFRFAELDRADAFWRGTAEDDGLRRGDARKALIDYLVRASSDRRGSGVSQLRAVAACWNAFYEGRVYARVAQLPFQGMVGVTLAGTPYRARASAGTLAVLAAANAERAGESDDSAGARP